MRDAGQRGGVSRHDVDVLAAAVGGLGSVAGSFFGAALLGICDVAGKYFVPEIGSFLIYLLLVAILFVRPLGLFGRR